MPAYSQLDAAQAGYAAYRLAMWPRVDHEHPLPPWTDLPVLQQRAWLKATEAITHSYNTLLAHLT